MSPNERKFINFIVFILAVLGAWMVAHAIDHRLIFGNWGDNKGEDGILMVFGISSLFLSMLAVAIL